MTTGFTNRDVRREDANHYPQRVLGIKEKFGDEIARWRRTVQGVGVGPTHRKPWRGLQCPLTSALDDVGGPMEYLAASAQLHRKRRGRRGGDGDRARSESCDASGLVFPWMGCEPGDVGNSRMLPRGWGLAFQHKIERYVDRKARRMARAARAQGRSRGPEGPSLQHRRQVDHPGVYYSPGQPRRRGVLRQRGRAGARYAALTPSRRPT
jgi:hypothetical protein